MFFQPFLLLIIVKAIVCELPVIVSVGASIEQVKGVTVYDDVFLLNQLISDLPDPPASIATPCPRGATQRSCSLSKHLHSILEDNAVMLNVLNRARTTYGLSGEILPEVNISRQSYRPVNEKELHNDPPREEFVKTVGQSWFDTVRFRLLERKTSTNSNFTLPAHVINRRWVQLLGKALLAGSAAMGADDLMDLASRLFVGENGILNFITTMAAISPDNTLVDLSQKVSEFEAESRRITSDLAMEAKEVQRLTEELQLDVAKQKMDLATVEDSHIVSQQMLSDLATTMFTYAIYFSFMDADTNCRNGNLSPLLIPPNLLSERIAEVIQEVPGDMKLAIGLNQLQLYYTTKSTSCIYDSNGGLLTLHIPLVYKSVDYKVFEYRNIFFAWEDKTCTLQSSARFVVKDVKNNKVFPVEDVDEEKCAPESTRMCKVPPFSDSAEAYCLNQLMSSSTVSDIRDACKMTCFKGQKPEVYKLHSNVFIAVHVPKNTVVVHCPNHEPYNITEKVTYGSIRITTNCNCKVTFEGKTVGMSTGPRCKGHESLEVDVLLPGHWTTLTDFLTFNHDGSKDVTKFQHQEEIFNDRWFDLNDKTEEEPYFTSQISLIGMMWNLMHTLAIVFMMFKLNLLNTASALTVLPLTEAASNHFCRIEDDVYYMLYAIIALCSLAFIPALIFKAYSFIGKQFWSAVDVAADRRLAEGIIV